MSESDEGWRKKLDELGAQPAEAQLEELLGEMVHQATSPGRVGVQVYLDPKRRELGRRLLVGLNANALLGMLYSEPVPDAEGQSWLLRSAVEAELTVRARLVGRLKQALLDKTWIDEPPPLVQSEPKPPRRRVCDDAYLLLRQLVHPEEDQVGFSVDATTFLNMPPDLRDSTIERALQSHTWNLRPPSPEDVGL